MHKSQRNLAVIAARAASRPVSRNRKSGIPLTSPTPVYATGPVRRSSAVSLTATQRNSEGRPSEWSRSMDFFTDPKWSQTVRSQNV